MAEIYDHNYSIGRPYCNIHERRGNGGDWREGHYVCNHGIVQIYSDERVTDFMTCKDGRRYYRTISGEYFTDRGLAIMAGKFIRELYNEK